MCIRDRSRSHSNHGRRHEVASGGGDRRRSSREDRRSRREGDANPPREPPPEAGDAGATTNGTGGSSPTTEESPSRTYRVSKEKIAGLLGKYDGKTCLDTFLNKFDKCIDYGEWNEVDKQFYLSTAREGAAAQICEILEEPPPTLPV